MKRFATAIIIIFLSACTTAPAPTPTATAIITKTPTPTQAPTATITPTPLPEFDICTLENFRDCEITEEDLLDGSYFRWLNEVIAPTWIPWFQEHEDKIKTNVRIRALGATYNRTGGSTMIISHDPDTAPNFTDPETAPFNRDVTFAYMPENWVTDEMRSYGVVATGYIVFPVFYYNIDDQTVHPIVMIKMSDFDDPAVVEKTIRRYREEMNESPFHATPDDGEYTDPIVDQAFRNVGYDEMERRVERFKTGDYAALSDERIILLGEICEGDSNLYE